MKRAVVVAHSFTQHSRMVGLPSIANPACRFWSSNLCCEVKRAGRLHKRTRTHLRPTMQKLSGGTRGAPVGRPKLDMIAMKSKGLSCTGAHPVAQISRTVASLQSARPRQFVARRSGRARRRFQTWPHRQAIRMWPAICR